MVTINKTRLAVDANGNPIQALFPDATDVLNNNTADITDANWLDGIEVVLILATTASYVRFTNVVTDVASSADLQIPANILYTFATHGRGFISALKSTGSAGSVYITIMT